MNKQAITRQTINWQCMLVICLAFLGERAAAQAKLVINGGVITINNGAALVIDNTDNTAITRNSSGYIKSEGAANKVIWTIGAGNGNGYLIPFGNAVAYLPVQFNAAGGAGAAGKFILSTYATPNWRNSEYLPSGVTNVNRGAVDNSANVIDRFWQVSPQGYTVNPSLTNLIFTYAEPEYAAPNTIIEANLIAQRWNTALQGWGDYIPAAVTNTATNRVTVAAIAGNQLYNWWTLVDLNAALPVTLTYFTAMAGNAVVHCNWQTVYEQNSDHFEVWRSKDGLQFEPAGSVHAAVNSSSTRNYAFADMHPYTGTSYYRLKSVDKDGSFKWSAIVTVTINNTTNIFLYPNPATNYISINSNIEILSKKPMARLYDAKGSLLQTCRITSVYQQVNIASLAAGAYQISLTYNDQIQTLRFIKQ